MNTPTSHFDRFKSSPSDLDHDPVCLQTGSSSLKTQSLFIMSDTFSSDLHEPLLESAVLYDVSSSESSPSTDANTAADSSMTWFDCIIIWTVLPMLLWVDFSMALVIQATTDEAATLVSARMVQLSIVLFILASYMYRKTIQEMRVTHVVIVLLPEILMDVILLLILFGKLWMAFRTLLWSVLSLSLVAMFYNIFVLCSKKQHDNELQGVRHEINDKTRSDASETAYEP